MEPRVQFSAGRAGLGGVYLAGIDDGPQLTGMTLLRFELMGEVPG